MNLEKLKVRNPNMDILRIIAVLCVIGIHFFTIRATITQQTIMR